MESDRQDRRRTRIARIARFAALPVLAAVFPVWSFYSNNATVVGPARVILPTIVAALGGYLVFALWARFCKSPSKGAVVALAYVVLFYLYRVLVPEGQFIPPGAEHLLLYGVGLFLFFMACVVAFAFYARAASRSFDLGAEILGVVVGIICLVPVVSVLSQGVLFVPSVRSAAPSQPLEAPSQPANEGPPRVRPDIYYVILDGYSRADVLRGIYDVDNSEFVAALEHRGFYVAARSRANYLQTVSSLAGTLNCTYLDELTATYGNSPSRRPVTDMVKNNWVMKYLREHGYALVNIASGYEFTSPMPNVDRELDFEHRILGEFETYLVRMTPLSDFLDDDAGSIHRKRVLYQLDSLANVPDLGKPRFVMCHIVSPHPPFVFDEAGAPVVTAAPYSLRDGSHYKGTREDYQRGYARQVKFLNPRLLAAIDAIQRKADPGNPPVIILQGDHGGGSFYDHESVAKSVLWERTSILNAYLVPPSVTSKLYPSITPVNTFRLLFTGLFDAQLEALPDRTFYAKWTRPFAFVELSEDQMSPT